jgi:hypothetical protein
MSKTRLSSKKGIQKYPLEPLKNYILAKRKVASISEKDLGEACGVSERRIRTARMEGGVDEYILDVMCVAAGIHPSELYDDWVNPLALFAGAIDEGKITVPEALAHGEAYLGDSA